MHYTYTLLPSKSKPTGVKRIEKLFTFTVSEVTGKAHKRSVRVGTYPQLSYHLSCERSQRAS